MRRLRPFPIAACLLPLVLTACGDSSSVDDPRTHAPLVRSAAVQGASDVSRSFTGVVAARVQGDLGFRVSGKVQERLVDTGQSVKRGQPLMRLDPIDLRLQAQAQHASVIAIRARAKQTADDEARYRNLVAAGAVSASTYDQIKAAADTAKAQLSAAHAQADVASNASGYAVLLADADGVVVETAGPADGSGARRAMEMALRQAAVSPADVQHINAHATSTPVGDRGELAAIHSLFGADSGVAISATKSATGHLLGAAGGVEAIFTVLALRDQIAPPTLNLMNPDEAASGLNLVALQPRNMPIDYALSNGFGFGGVNASLLFRRWHD